MNQFSVTEYFSFLKLSEFPTSKYSIYLPPHSGLQREMINRAVQTLDYKNLPKVYI